MAPQQQQQSQNTTGGDNTNHSEQADDKDMSVEELLYSTTSFHAIIKPVTLTMILTALCVIYVNTPETFQATQDQLSSTYVAFKPEDDASTATKVGYSVTNALIIVSVICAMTFCIVLLYKYRCLKVLMGYMIFASAALLGLLGGNMLQVAVDKYQLSLDTFSYYFCLWNFAFVGTGAIFWPHGGFPMWTTQGYLISTSVILAWQLSAFDSWTSWTLLVILALYDLCAVLTPCGPLKALVNLMSQEDSPDMPGLLYEAELPQEAQRPGRQPQQQRQSIETTTTRTTTGQETSSATTTTTTMRNRRQQPSTTGATATDNSESEVDVELASRVSLSHEPTPTVIDVNENAPALSSTAEASTSMNNSVSPLTVPESTASDTVPAPPPPPPPTASLPFAIAKLFKLRLQSPEPERQSSWTPPSEGEDLSPNELFARQYTPEQLKAQVVAVFPRNGGRIDVVGNKYVVKDINGIVKRILLVDDQGRVLEERQQIPEDPTASLPFAIAKLYKLPLQSPEPERRSSWTPPSEGEDLSPNELLARQYTPEQLKAQVVAVFPRNGGRIVVVGNKYVVKDRHGNVKRILLMDDQGRVLTERQQTPEEEREEARRSNSIKLGLGDFIFYSVLVSKAALYSFTTFVACMLVILAGLGLTLVLLAVYHKALPALPISIFLGVIFYLVTRALIEPWFQAILITPYYV